MGGLGRWQVRGWTSALTAAPTPPIALDFGTSSLRLLQIAPGDQPALVAAVSDPVPDALRDNPVARFEHQLASLPRLVKDAGFKGRRTVCALPASHTFCKHLQVQAEPGVPVAVSALNQVSVTLGCLPDALRCRSIETGAMPGGKHEVIALAVAQGVVKRAMDAMRAAKLDPVGMQPECLAVLRCFDHITRRTEDVELVTLYLDLGAGSTRVLIAHGQNLVFAKSIAIGGHYLDQTAARQLACPLEEARRQRLAIAAITAAPKPEPAAAQGAMSIITGRAPMAGRAGAAGESSAGEAGGTATATDSRGNLPPPNTSTIEPTRASPMRDQRLDLHEPLDTLTDEIGLCLRYHQTVFPGKRVARVVFVGGEARHTALCQHIARTLKTAAHVADPLARLARTGQERVQGVDVREPQPGWAVAMGLCLSPTDL